MPALAELDFQLSDTFLASNSMLCFSNLQDVSLSLDPGPNVTLLDSTACHHIFLSHSTTLLPMGSSPSFWTVSRRPAATPLSISRWNHTHERIVTRQSGSCAVPGRPAAMHGIQRPLLSKARCQVERRPDRQRPALGTTLHQTRMGLEHVGWDHAQRAPTASADRSIFRSHCTRPRHMSVYRTHPLASEPGFNLTSHVLRWRRRLD